MTPLSGIHGASDSGLTRRAPSASYGKVIDQVSADPAPQAATGQGSDSVRLSGAGQLLAQFQQLRELGPERFREVITSIASLFRQAGAPLGASNEGQLLASLADSFQQVADSGDLSPLAPRAATPVTSMPHQRYQQAQARAEVSVLDLLAGQGPGRAGPFAPTGPVASALTRVTETILRGALGG